MDWAPNEDAIDWYSRDILPLIRNEYPDVVTWVVGRNPTSSVRALERVIPNLHITGRVDDIRPYLEQACVYITPMRSGSGTRLKVFEALASGKAIVSTSLGAEGLPVEHEKNILLAETPEDFARQCVWLLGDPDLILHSFEQHGPASVEQFRGMFAFALWDKRRRTLFCARDRLGIKPFYYYWDGKVFAFASEIKALLEHPSVSPQFEDSLLSEYLAFGYVSGERTLFRGIKKLMPGHWLRLDLGYDPDTPRLEMRQYWEVPEPQNAEPRDDADWISECRRRLEETVRMRLMSDVPLGMFLSGGVDSSAIAALM
jgi:hypothetical protein